MAQSHQYRRINAMPQVDADAPALATSGGQQRYVDFNGFQVS
jgi:thiamine biosynthesis lipoprotein ApbE